MIKFKYLPILLLPLGCIGISSSFQLIAGVIFLYYYFNKNFESDFKVFFTSKIVKHSFIFFLLWIIGMGISDSLLNGSIKESWNFFQRILPFFLVGMFSIRNNIFFKYAWIGIAVSLLIVDCNVIYHFFEQGHLRPITMFNSPNRLGAFLILLLPFVFGGILNYKDDLILKFFGIIVFVLGIISLIISYSRGAMLGIILGIFICFVVIEYRKCNLRNFLLNIVAGIFICVLCALFIYMFFPEMISRSYDIERVYLWQSAIRIFIDFPILGVGAGNFNEVYLNGYINTFAKEPNLVTPHNIYLWFASERGLVAVLPFIMMIIYQISIFSKAVFTSDNKINIWACCGLIVIVGMSVHGLVDTTMNNRTYQLMYWLLYGLSCYSIIYKEQNNE